MATDTSFGKVRSFDDFNRKAIDTTNLYTSNTDGGGTAFAIQTLANGVVRGTVDTDDNDITNLFGVVIYRPSAGGPLIFESRVKAVTSVADGETYIGLTDEVTDENPITLSTADVQTSGATNAAGFAYTGAGTANWKAVAVKGDADATPVACSKGGATTPVVGTYQTLRAVLNEDGDADYYINGIWQARIDNAVTAATLLCDAWAVQSGGTARSLDVDYKLVECGRV